MEIDISEYGGPRECLGKDVPVDSRMAIFDQCDSRPQNQS